MGGDRGLVLANLVTLSDQDLQDDPRSARLVKTVRGREHTITCRGVTRWGYRLQCSQCQRWVKQLYLPEGKVVFGCGQCYKAEFRPSWQGVISWAKLLSKWPDKTY